MGNLNQQSISHLGKEELPHSFRSLLRNELPTLRAASAFNQPQQELKAAIQRSLAALTGAAGSPGLDLDTAIQLALEKEAE